MKDQRTEKAIREGNLAVLTNVVELAAQVVMKIAGNEISNTVDGKAITPAFLKEAMIAKAQSVISTQMGVR